MLKEKIQMKKQDMILIGLFTLLIELAIFYSAEHFGMKEMWLNMMIALLEVAMIFLIIGLVLTLVLFVKKYISNIPKEQSNIEIKTLIKNLVIWIFGIIIFITPYLFWIWMI